MRALPCRMLTLALLWATPRTTGAKPRSKSGSMASSLASCTPVKGTLSKLSPGVKYSPRVSWALREVTSRCA